MWKAGRPGERDTSIETGTGSAPTMTQDVTDVLMSRTYGRGVTRMGATTAYRSIVHWIPVAIFIVITLGIAAVTVHLILVWAERRGWVYYRSTDRPNPPPLGLLEEIYQPSMTHVIEERSEEEARADQSESGEPDDAQD